MCTRMLSLDQMQEYLGSMDPEDDSTNRTGFEAASAALHSALEQELTHRQRECVRLYYYEKLTLKNTGECLGISKSTVCRHLQKAKSRLGRAISYAGISRFSLE